MAEQENVGVVQAAYAAFGRGDIPGVLGHIAEEVDWVLAGPADIIPIAGTRHGTEGAREFFKILAETSEPLVFEPREFVAQGDKVIALGFYRWRIFATGREAESDFAHVFTLRAGKIVRFQEYYDTYAVAAAHRSG